MVLGNHALQRGYHPRALSDWFREAFVDGFEWVMPTNVIGMSQHADGGMLATKPYSAGGAYINRMSDHCGHCAFDPRKRLGDDACPFTAGYWAWVHRHRDLLAANNRTAAGGGHRWRGSRTWMRCWSRSRRGRSSDFHAASNANSWSRSGPGVGGRGSSPRRSIRRCRSGRARTSWGSAVQSTVSSKPRKTSAS